MNKERKTIILYWTFFAIGLIALILFFVSIGLDIDTAKAEGGLYTISNEQIKLSVTAKEITDTEPFTYNDIMQFTQLTVSGRILVGEHSKITNNGFSVVESYTFDNLKLVTSVTNRPAVTTYNGNNSQQTVLYYNNSLNQAWVTQCIIEFDNQTDYDTFMNKQISTDVKMEDIFEPLMNKYEIILYEGDTAPQLYPDLSFTGSVYMTNDLNEMVHDPERLQNITVNYDRTLGIIQYTLPATTEYAFYEILIVENSVDNEFSVIPYLYSLNFSMTGAISNEISLILTDVATPHEFIYNQSGYLEQVDAATDQTEVIGIAYETISSTTQKTIQLQFSKTAYVQGYQNGIADKERAELAAFNRGYEEGRQIGEEGDFYHLITAVFSVPVQTIIGFTDVEILGVNMLSVLKGIMTLCIVACIIKWVI